MNNIEMLFLMSEIDNDLIMELTEERRKLKSVTGLPHRKRNIVAIVSSVAAVTVIVFGLRYFLLDSGGSTTEPVTQVTDSTSAVRPTIAENTSDTSASSLKNVNQDQKENNVGFYSISADKLRSYNSFDELATVASVVVSGECVETNTIYKLGNIYTLSKIRVSGVYKGNVSAGEIICVVECGGRTSYGEYTANCNTSGKEFDNKGDSISDDYQVVIGMAGIFPLQTDDSVLLFLEDTSGFLPDFNEPLYDIIGDSDGKFYAQEDGTYKKPSPSQTDNYIFEDGNLTINVTELQSIGRS